MYTECQKKSCIVIILPEFHNNNKASAKDTLSKILNALCLDITFRCLEGKQRFQIYSLESHYLLLLNLKYLLFWHSEYIIYMIISFVKYYTVVLPTELKLLKPSNHNQKALSLMMFVSHFTFSDWLSTKTICSVAARKSLQPLICD